MLTDCGVCNKMYARQRVQPLKPIEILYPFDLVSLDTGKFTYAPGKIGIFLVAIDHFTKWVEVKIVTRETSITIEAFVQEHILFCHGCPGRIQTDGGKPYTSQHLKKFLARHNIQHTITAPYHPKSNKAAEKIIGTIKGSLKKVKLGGEQWRKALHIAVGTYQMFPHQGTGFSPFKMLYGREAVWAEEVPHVVYDCDQTYYEAVENHVGNMIRTHESAMTKNLAYLKSMKKDFDRSKVAEGARTGYKLGDLVWVDVRRQSKANQGGTIKWVGPCAIKLIMAGPLYQVEYTSKGSTLTFNRVHPQFMKAFKGESG